jgi:hypothetical protein
MLQVLDEMWAITLAIDHYIQGKPGGLTIKQILTARMATEKRLLHLPNSKEINTIPRLSPMMYEYCRLTAMIFGVAIVYPIYTHDNLQVYVTRLKAAIKESWLETCESQNANLSNSFLWILVLGGIAAVDKPERHWFVSQFGLLVKKMKIVWSGVEEVLETFMWLDSACGLGGRHLWAEVENLVF